MANNRGGDQERFLAAAIQRAQRQLRHARQVRKSAETVLADAASSGRTRHKACEPPRSVLPETAVDPPGAGDCSVSKPVRVVVYSDQPMLATGLQSCIASDADLRLSACCTDLSELREQLLERQPHVAVLDLTPEITPLLLRELRSLAPDCRLVLWTDSIAPDFALQAMAVGISGILRKTLSEELHRRCLLKVHGGELWFERRLMESFHRGNCVALSPREARIVGLLSQGLKNREISAELGITEGTLKVYLYHLYKKCGVRSRLDMAVYGQQNMSMAGSSGSGAAGLWSRVPDSSEDDLPVEKPKVFSAGGFAF